VTECGLKALYDTLTARLRVGGIETPEFDARLLITARTGFGWADILARPEVRVTQEEARALECDVQRRLESMPVSRLLGEREFYGLSFMLGPETLDPRPDTETVVEAARNAFKGQWPERILDLGTGSGCLLVTLLHLWPRAWGLGVDRAFGALVLARANAARHAVAARAGFVQGHWGEGVDGAFDLIVSNPPYIPNRDIGFLSKEVRNHDPILALDGGEDGLDSIRSVIAEIKKRLAPHGAAFVEIGFGQAPDVARLVEKSGLSPSRTHADLAGVERVFEIRRGDK
jgi:release factor glutamine methyltransferase